MVYKTCRWVEPFSISEDRWSLNGPSHPLQIGGIKKMNEEEYRQKKLVLMEALIEVLTKIERKM